MVDGAASREYCRVVEPVTVWMVHLGLQAGAKPPDVDSSKLRSMVTVAGMVEHQRALQNIADATGGTRHTTTPGYDASVAYVRDTMTKAGRISE